MALLKILNKSNNTIYVYESTSYWDKEKKQPRSNRKLIGKIDPETGEVIPTGRSGRRPKDKEAKAPYTSTAVAADSSDGLLDESDPSDYKALYEKTKKMLLVKESALSDLENKFQNLSKKHQELVEQLYHLAKRYGSDNNPFDSHV